MTASELSLASRDAFSTDEKCSIRISDQLEDSEWDNFVSMAPGGSHVQTSLWAQIKADLGYRPLRIIVRDSEQIRGGGQLLVRSVAPGVRVGFMPKGPIFSASSSFLQEKFLHELHQAAKDYRIGFLAIQPALENESFSGWMFSLGLRPSWLELASTATILIDLSLEPDKILTQMKRQTRQNIRRSEREGVTCREGDESDLTMFYTLHLATSERQGFKPYPSEYYRKMWQVFEPRGYVKLIIAEYNSEAVSALLLVPFNDTVVAKILGWSGQHPDLRPNDAVFWASILWAKSQGFRYFDLEGIDRRGATNVLQGLPLEGETKDSYTFFKLGYGGQIVLYPQAYDYIYNPLVRWVYGRIFDASDRGSNFYMSLDRIRRRLRL